MKYSYRFYTNRDCKYFPCHEYKGDFNCMFCYCPLYLLDRECGGNFQYVGGVKDCSNCLIPHTVKGYDYINDRLREEIEKRKKTHAE
ncbi:cysteine-rich small domain-containing protein [Aedoeadaptatus coxii]|uniref:cysteine-rich small domain-containing protein n=1 Tax=Aedoeadaptatus coxii TaxID=755172 RepID=UPI002AD4EF3C|nr:cysteine-rich small domain-containing protein [Peptoniphilus coxii]